MNVFFRPRRTTRAHCGNESDASGFEEGCPKKMAVIDAQGLFGGERLAACSDKAKLLWPFLFLAANGYGNLELTYQDIVSRVFVNFQKAPKEDELWAIFEEYANNYLVILYPVDGLRWWAQFDTSEKYLPRYKTVADDNSPKPPSDLIEKHRNGYVQWKTAKSLSHQHFQKFAENSGKLPKVSDGKGRGGVGVGVGVGKSGKDAASGFSLPDFIKAEAYSAWREMRVKIPKAPFTERAESGIIADLCKLKEMGIDPNERLEKALRSSWRGVLFEDDKARGGLATVAPKAKSQYEIDRDEQQAERREAVRLAGAQ